MGQVQLSIEDGARGGRFAGSQNLIPALLQILNVVGQGLLAGVFCLGAGDEAAMLVAGNQRQQSGLEDLSGLGILDALADPNPRLVAGWVGFGVVGQVDQVATGNG